VWAYFPWRRSRPAPEPRIPTKVTSSYRKWEPLKHFSLSDSEVGQLTALLTADGCLISTHGAARQSTCDCVAVSSLSVSYRKVVNLWAASSAMSGDNISCNVVRAVAHWTTGFPHHSHPSLAGFRNAWSYTSTPAYVFMAWCLIKHRDNCKGQCVPFYGIVWIIVGSSKIRMASKSWWVLCRGSARILRKWAIRSTYEVVFKPFNTMFTAYSSVFGIKEYR
jgi:hypothetical protein